MASTAGSARGRSRRRCCAPIRRPRSCRRAAPPRSRRCRKSRRSRPSTCPTVAEARVECAVGVVARDREVGVDVRGVPGDDDLAVSLQCHGTARRRARSRPRSSPCPCCRSWCRGCRRRSGASARSRSRRSRRCRWRRCPRARTCHRPARPILANELTGERQLAADAEACVEAAVGVVADDVGVPVRSRCAADDLRNAAAHDNRAIRLQHDVARRVGGAADVGRDLAAPPMPKLVSRLPLALKRATAKSLESLPLVPNEKSPASTILPSGWIATA